MVVILNKFPLNNLQSCTAWVLHCKPGLFNYCLCNLPQKIFQTKLGTAELLRHDENFIYQGFYREKKKVRLSKELGFALTSKPSPYDDRYYQNFYDCFFTRSMLCTGPWIFPCICGTSRTSHQWGLRPGTRKTVWKHNSIEIIYLCWHQTKEIEWSGLEAWSRQGCEEWGGRSWTLGENKQTTLTFIISSSSHHLVTTILGWSHSIIHRESGICVFQR